MADQVNRLVSLDTFAGIRDRFYSIVAVLDVAAVSEERHHYDLIQYHLESAGGSCRQQRCRRSAGRMPALNGGQRCQLTLHC